MLSACYEREVVIAFTFPRDSNEWNFQKKFIIAFIENYLPIAADGVRVSVVTFTYFQVKLEFALSQYTNEDDLKAAINSLEFKAETQGNAAKLMNEVNNLAFSISRDVQKTLILFMGYPLLNKKEVFTAANNLAIQGINIIAFDVTNSISLSDLRQIGSRLQNNIQTNDYKFLRRKLPQLGSVVCGEQSGL